jgi:hypothetical protein
MNRYQVKIENSVLPECYSFDELIANGLLDERDENIQVKLINDSEWVTARDYPFSRSEALDNNSTSSSSNYTIDEYGQIIRGDTNNRFSLSTESLHFTDEGSTRTINVTSSKPWYISLNAASWVTLSPNGNSLTVKVGRNFSSDSRNDYFKLKSGDKERKVDIYQSGSKSSSTSSSTSADDDNDGCVWAIIIGIGIITLAAIM